MTGHVGAEMPDDLSQYTLSSKISCKLQVACTGSAARVGRSRLCRPADRDKPAKMSGIHFAVGMPTTAHL